MQNIKRRKNSRLPPKVKPEATWCRGSRQKVQGRSSAARAKERAVRAKEWATPLTYTEKKAKEKQRLLDYQSRWFVRCPECNKRLHPQILWDDMDQEFVGMYIPRHKGK